MEEGRIAPISLPVYLHLLGIDHMIEETYVAYVPMYLSLKALKVQKLSQQVSNLSYL